MESVDDFSESFASDKFEKINCVTLNGVVVVVVSVNKCFVYFETYSVTVAVIS